MHICIHDIVYGFKLLQLKVSNTVPHSDWQGLLDRRGAFVLHPFTKSPDSCQTLLEFC